MVIILVSPADRVPSPFLPVQAANTFQLYARLRGPGSTPLYLKTTGSSLKTTLCQARVDVCNRGTVTLAIRDRTAPHRTVVALLGEAGGAEHSVL